VLSLESVFSLDTSAPVPPDANFAEDTNLIELDTWEDDEEAEDFAWEEDLFDQTYGLEDFGYEEDFTLLTHELPPSLALAAVDALEGSAIQPSVDMPDLQHLEAPQRQELQELLSRYEGLFDGGDEAVGHVPGIQHRINTGAATPVCTRQWRLPQATKDIIREQCNSMLNNGVIEPSTSPWLSPVVLVKKKCGSLRFCVDYRNLNAVTTADTYPLPRIEELIDELGPTDTFTTLDARSAYWSVDVHPADRPKTAFSDGYRLSVLQATFWP